MSSDGLAAAGVFETETLAQPSARAHRLSIVRRLSVVLLLALLGGCGTTRPSPSVAPEVSPSPGASSLKPSVHISNATTLLVTLVVNGQRVVDAPPGGPIPTIDVSTQLPQLPWIIEARSPSGRVLVSMDVRPADVQPETSRARFVDLSCGRIWIWVGDVMPDAPAPIGSRADCVS
jgi:hypothetical protein